MIAQFNQRTFRRPDVVRELATWDWVEAGENLLLQRIEDEIQDGEILDIGVGAGRLVPRLFRLGKSYIGIDYSPEMVKGCRNKFPSVPFLCADARNLSQFQNGKFALVVFSFNGIDYVPHLDRLGILNEVWRVLAVGGFFLFSSHNLESSMYLKQATNSVGNLSDYSIVREDIKNVVYFCYYARQAEVRRQLWATGFKAILECCNRDGLEPGHDLRSGWLHYLAQK